MSRDQGWLRMFRGHDIDTFQERDPQGFLLLCQIARRARWSEGTCPVSGLEQGQCFIGDYKSAGLKTEKRYREAKARLQKRGICVFKRATGTANGGTVATLVNWSFFAPANPGGATEAADKGRPRGDRRATKKKVRREEDKASSQNEWEGSAL